MKTGFLQTAALLLLSCASSRAAFDFEEWKTQYGTALTPSQFYSSRPGPWGNYFSSTSVDCANATFLYLGPLGVKARPFDQALSTPAFSALYPAFLTDSGGLIQNSFGVMDVPAGAPADGNLYPGDVILEIEDQPIKTAGDVSFPFPMQAKSSRGLEIHAGQLVDLAEGRGAVKMKLMRAAKTAWNGGTFNSPSTSADVTLDVTGQDFVRLITSSSNNALTNWINPRIDDGTTTLYLNAQTIIQKSGYASPIMGKDATNATVYNGATTINNCIGTRGNSMIEYAVPAGYTTLKFTVQTTGTGSGSGSILPKAGLRKSTLSTTPPNPRQFDTSGAPVLPPELADYIETVEFPVPRIGSFGSTYDPNSEKVANYASILAERLALQQNADGSWPSGGGDYADGSFRTSLAGLGLLATGNPAFNTHLQKAATYCANVTPSGWAYPRGTRLMFIAEYYLRTRDAAILPGLQKAVNEAEDMITADFTCGHGLNMGYGGAGYIGSTGTIGTGLAIASKCPVIVNTWKLDNLLERVQELAGGNGGALPYSRGGIGRSSFPETPSNGQSYSCGAGGVLATKIRGGPQYITELFRKKFGAATTYGDADGGHASEALTFIMGSLACQIWGDDAHQANMNRFLWRLTLKRDYSGYINLNTNRLEFHGGDGGVHGGPTYDTGGYLILFNSHRHNLAITGKPEHQATVFPNTPPTYDVDRKLYWRVLNDWNMVDAALGSKMPSSLQPKLAELRNMPLGADLATRTLAFLQREALPAANLVNGVSGLTSPEKQFYCEMVLGIGHDITAVSIDDPVPTTGLSNYRFSLNGYTAATTWDSWGGPTLSPDPVPTTQMSGTVTLTDPSGLYFTTPRVLNFSPGSLNPTTDFQVPVTSQVTLTAAFNYTVGGSLPITYTKDIMLNPSVPFNVDNRAGNYTNMRKVWIPGNCPIPFEKWNMPVQLLSGITLPGASKNEGTIGFHTYDNGTLVSANDVYKAKIRGKPAGYWAVSSDRWGECAILGVNLLSGAAVTTDPVNAINPTFATSGGNVTADNGWPVTTRGVCWSTTPYPTIYDNKTVNGSATGSFVSNITGLEPGTVYHVRAYATSAIGTSYGTNLPFTTAGSNGTWITNGGGSWTNTTNWQGGIDASGADGVADFSSVTPVADATVTLNGPRSIGGIVFGNASFTNNWTLNPGTSGSLSLDIGANGNPAINVSGGGAVINTMLLGVDGLVKAGPGSLTLAAASPYTGLTSVNAGTLHVTGSLSAGSPVNVGAAGTLTGTGSLGSHLTVNGTLAPGAGSIGTLVVDGKVTLAGTAVMEIHKAAATCDNTTGSNSVSYGGTLTVTNLGGTLAAGDKFILFQASAYTGAFATLNLPALTGSLEWDTSGLLVDGSILVGFDAAITGQPSDQSVGQGVGATFTVTATGLPTPIYLWQVSTNGGGSWTDIPGATNASYNTGTTTSGDSGKQFHCVVSNGLAAVTSNAATLTVTSDSLPAFTQHPLSVFHVAAGQSASFTISATGTPAPTYQWQLSTNAGSTWTKISGATAETYSFTSASGDNGTAYRCVATNIQGSANSNIAQFIISTDPIWTNPAGGSWPVISNWTNSTVAAGSGITADFSRLILPSPPTVTLDGAHTIGSLVFGDAAALASWTLTSGSGGPLTLAVTSGSPTITVNNQSATISAVLAGSNGLTKNGAGNLVLAGSNTFTGGTTLATGQLTLNHSNALAGNSLTITGGSLGNSSDSSVTLPGSQAWNGNFTYVGPNNMTISGAVTLGANRTLTVEGGDLTVSGVISGAYSLTKAGSSMLVLGAQNTFTGGLTVNAGTVSLKPGDHVNALPANAPVTINNGGTVIHADTNVTNNGTAFTIHAGGTLGLTSYHAHLAAITLNGGTILGTGSGKYASEDFALDGNLTVGGSSASTINIANGIGIGIGNRTFNIANATGDPAADLTVSGPGAIRGTGKMTKSGAGTLVLANQNSYSGGTLVSSGILQLAGGSLGSGTVTVSTGATLSGNGNIDGATTVAGTLSPGTATTLGTLAFGTNLSLTGTTVIKLAKTGATITKDNISTGNTLTCGGTLTVTASGDALATGDTIQLFSAGSFSDTFSSVNLPVLSGGLVWDTSKLYINGSISLGKIAQSVSFEPLPSLAPGDVLRLDATASSGLTVAYTSSNPAVALIQFGDYLTAIGTGTTTITASQNGNAFHQVAVNVDQTLTVNATLPAVSTVNPALLTNSSASSGGGNVWDGGLSVTERGVCWSTSPDPTVTNNHTTDGSGTGSFTSTITGLTANTTYYVRAYARNAIGYGYGGSSAVVTPPEAVDGVWAVNASGSWPTVTNWTGGASPNGLGSTANFGTLNITADRTVTLDSAVNISSVIFGDTTASHNWILNPGASGALTLNTITGTPAIIVSNQSATFGLPLTGTKGLVKEGAGTLNLGTVSTFTGGFTVNGGRVNLQSAANTNTLAAGNIVTINSGGTVGLVNTNVTNNNVAFVVNPGGALNCQGSHEHLFGLTLNGGTVTGTGSGKYNNEDFFLDVDVNVGGSSPSSIQIANGIGIGNRTFNVADATNSPAADLNISGAGAFRGTGVLTKSGLGTLALANANVHTGGTFVAAGTLLASNNTGSATGTGAVTVATGATLGGNGSISGALSANGTLAPGNNGIGMLTTGALTLPPSSAVQWEISDWNGSAGTGYDRINAASLAITATRATKTVLTISPASLANFTDTDKNFTLLQTTGGITGFDPANFLINTTAFTAGNGMWSLALSGNDIVLQYRTVLQNPVFNNNPLTGAAAYIGYPYSSSLAGQATDPNGDAIIYSKISGPSWLTIAADGTLAGMLAAGDDGPNAFVVRASDPSLNYSEATLQILVSVKTNTPPAFNMDELAKTQATPGTAYSASLTGDVTDLDEDPLSFEKLSGLSWLTISSNGTLGGTPASGDAGQNSFIVRVSDGQGGSDIALLTIQVGPPTGYPADNYGTLRGTNTTDEFIQRVQIGNIDKTSGNNSGYADFKAMIAQLTPGQAVSYTLVPGFSGTIFNEAWTVWIDFNRDGDFADSGENVVQLAASNATRTGNISIPGTAAVGPSRMRVAMRYNTPQTSPTGTFTYGEVEDYSVMIGTMPPVNAAPYFFENPIAWSAVAQGTPASGSLASKAVDWENHTLSFSKISGPAWLQIAADGELSGTPANSDVGNAVFSIRVTDSMGGSESSELRITVTNTNDAPLFPANPINLSAAAHSAFSGQLEASDADPGETLTFSKVSGPAWLAASTNGSLTGTPLGADAGGNVFTVRVTDGGGLFAETTLVVTVTLTPTQSWQVAQFGANANNPAIAGDLADPDGDGLKNLIEYALGTNPNIAGSSGITSDLANIAGTDHLRLTVNRNPAATDVTLTVETCADLTGWSSATTFIETDTANQLIVRDTGTGPRRFIHVKVTR